MIVVGWLLGCAKESPSALEIRVSSLRFQQWVYFSVPIFHYIDVIFEGFIFRQSLLLEVFTCNFKRVYVFLEITRK